MDPFVTGSLITAGAGLLGGAIGGSKGMSADKAFGLNHGLMKSQMRFQQNMDKTLIRRRVRDAKKAGLHPLFALGATPGNFGTTPGNFQGMPSENGLGDALANAGQALAHGLQLKQQAKMQKEYNGLLNKKLRAEIKETDARTKNINVKTGDFVTRSIEASMARNVANQINGTQARNVPEPKVLVPDIISQKHSQFKTPYGNYVPPSGWSPVEHLEGMSGEAAGVVGSIGMLIDSLSRAVFGYKHPITKLNSRKKRKQRRADPSYYQKRGKYGIFNR